MTAKKREQENGIIETLLRDPTKSTSKMSKELNCYRQTIWRTRKKLEESRVIWGYTTVVDERKLGKITYIVLMKTKPMSRELANLISDRIRKGIPGKLGVRLIDLFYVNGEYDWIMRFSAPNHPTARRYYDTIRVIYEEYLLEKPVIVDVNFCLVAEGKTNPDLEDLYEFSAK